MSVRAFLTVVSIWILGLETRSALNSVVSATNPMMAGMEQKSKGRVNSLLDTGHPSSLAPELWSSWFLHLQTLWPTLQPLGSHVFELELICITCFPGSPACRLWDFLTSKTAWDNSSNKSFCLSISLSLFIFLPSLLSFLFCWFYFSRES